MNPSLAEHRILICGAAGTLGRSAALACSDAGATVVLLDKNINVLKRVYDEIVARGGPEPAIYPLDLSGATEQDYADLAEVLEREFGALHGLLHSAAELAALGPIADVSSRDFDRIFRVNCGAPLQLTRALLGLMKRTGRSSIVFIGDSSARRGRAYWGAYGISKIALEGLASILADELEQSGRIRVNTLIPGPFRSPIQLRAYPGLNREALPQAEALAPALVYLLSEESRVLHGQVIDARQLISTQPPEGHHYVRT